MIEKKLQRLDSLSKKKDSLRTDLGYYTKKVKDIKHTLSETITEIEQLKKEISDYESKLSI